MEAKNYEFRMVNAGNLKAMVALTYGELRISGFKILVGKNGGLWLGMPSRAFTRRDGTEAYASVVWIDDEKTRRRLERSVLDAYRQEKVKEASLTPAAAAAEN